jgi:hypothetical protein
VRLRECAREDPMLRNSIETEVRRELEKVPLPPEEEWVPRRVRKASAWSTAGWICAGAIAIVFALVAGAGLHE